MRVGVLGSRKPASSIVNCSITTLSALGKRRGRDVSPKNTGLCAHHANVGPRSASGPNVNRLPLISLGVIRT